MPEHNDGMMAWRQRYEQYANQTLATFRPLGLTGLGSRKLRAGVQERNLDRGLETLLLSYGRPYMCRRYCLPRGPLACRRLG